MAEDTHQYILKPHSNSDKSPLWKVNSEGHKYVGTKRDMNKFFNNEPTIYINLHK